MKKDGNLVSKGDQMDHFLTNELLRQLCKKLIETVFNILSNCFKTSPKKRRKEKRPKQRTTKMEFSYSKKTEKRETFISLSKVTQNGRESAATNSLPNKKM
ncbi:hypothetical protein HCJ46_16415 [Listeria booriae]|nr:hypothetical protein [Listeria booriae]